MGVTKGRVSQIERGLISTQDVLARYAEAEGRCESRTQIVVDRQA